MRMKIASLGRARVTLAVVPPLVVALPRYLLVSSVSCKDPIASPDGTLESCQRSKVGLCFGIDMHERLHGPAKRLETKDNKRSDAKANGPRPKTSASKALKGHGPAGCEMVEGARFLRSKLRRALHCTSLQDLERRRP